MKSEVKLELKRKKFSDWHSQKFYGGKPRKLVQTFGHLREG